MSSTNLSLLLASTLSLIISLKRPNPPPDASERVKVPHSDTTFVLGGVLILPILASVACIAAAAVVLALTFPSSISSQILHYLLPTGNISDFALSHYLIASTVFTIVAGFGRIWCYRTLGRHFTYELSLQKGHRLVTDGPYAFVRHPSYTAVISAVVGLTFVHLSPGSFARSCGWLDTVFGRTLLGVWVIQTILSSVALFARTKREDVMLKEHFGEEWENYARRVRYRVVPGVY
ncbi:hypothetical protein BV22DRAFT_1045868 [Leucogyrophana mollusca]|uniref:Uncharacterized protein n=1 Tax=Leucogyrophana mollusca TaxID=85980 RepID=A0ACB8BMI7_9AGAM|nr:hypothetical protein BV22DRAFT_1045868 [Leucogyrophana mollusca]